MKEYGRIGQNRWEGIFYEEFLPELRGIRGIKAYREMMDNDDTVGALMFAIKMIIRNAKWSVTPSGDTEIDIKAAEFVESCLNDMQHTWTDTVSEILSFLGYGWSYHEIVYKRRNGKTKNRYSSSRYSDGLIGWQKLPIRSQDTLYRWEYDDKDNLIGMTQYPPPTYEYLTIPIRKALHFRTESTKDNPEGRSILRNAYRSWYFKRRIQELEAIGIERDLAGLPIIYTPGDLDIWNKEDAEAYEIYTHLVQLIKNVRRNENEGLVLPEDYKMELLSTGGTRQFDTTQIINRYDTKIAMTVLADFLMLGHQNVGSFALSANKTQLFTVAIGAYQDIICETMNNQGIPALIDINGDHFNGITDYPKLTHGDVEDVDIEKFASYLEKMVGIGVIVPDSELENYVRDVGGLPDRVEDADEGTGADPKREAQRRKNGSGDADVPEDDDEPAEDEIRTAKARLGR